MSGLRTFEYLTSPELAPLYWPGVVTGLAIAVLCSALSVIVVLKRMAFIGQGISHAAFGGVGVAAALGLAAGGVGSAGVSGGGGTSIGYLLVVLAFCLAAGLGIGWLSGGSNGGGGSGSSGGKTQADTAIGIVLVASMALGAVLLQYAYSRGRGAGVAWESLLFGSITDVAWGDAAIAWVVAGAVVVTLAATRRSMLFWAFDEPGSEAFGVPAGRMRLLLLLMLAVATVTAMRLAGVVLATAMLVLPGAAALQLSRRLGSVMAWSVVIAVAGVLGGLVLSFEADKPTGACVVLVLSAVFGAAWGRNGLRGGLVKRAPRVS